MYWSPLSILETPLDNMNKPPLGRYAVPDGNRGDRLDRRGGSDDTAPRFLFVIVIVIIIIIIILYLCSLDEVPVLYLIDLGGTLLFFFSKLDCPKEEKKENKIPTVE